MPSILDLAGYVQQQGQMGREAGQRSRLAKIASQAYGAAPDQQRALIGQAVGVDPQAGLALGKGLEDVQGRKMQRAGQIASLIADAPDDATRAQIYAQVAPEMQSMGFPVPQHYSPQILPMIQKAASMMAGMQGSQTPAGYREFELMAGAAGVQGDERARAARIALGMDPRASSAAIQYREVEGPDGRKRLVAVDPRQVGAQVIGDGASYGSGVPSPQQPQPPSQGYAPVEGDQTAIIEAEIGRPLTAQERQQIASGTLNLQVPPQGGALPPRLDYQRGGNANPFVSRSPEETAGAKKEAEIRAELSLAPEQARADAERQRLIKEADLGVERKGQAPKARMAMEQARARVNRVDSLIQSIQPRINRWTAGWLGDKLSEVQGTDAADLRKDLATLQAIAGFDELNAMRASSPTGGALGNVTERELAFLQSVIRNIENSQSPEQLRRNLAAFGDELRGSWERVRAAYEQDFGRQGGKADSGDQAPSKRLRFNPATGRIE